MHEARLDKWLWAARIFKTRTMAADACKKKRITKNGQPLKPSHILREGDVVEVRKPPITYSFRVKQAIEKRVGAKLLPDVLENITPKKQYEILEMSNISMFARRPKGAGRPTKKERRLIDEQTSPLYFDSEADGGFDFDLDDADADGDEENFDADDSSLGDKE
jgi:ribosome-associated heat shock protein Hsp15